MQQEERHTLESEQQLPSRVEKYGRKRKIEKKEKKQTKKVNRQTEFIPTNIILWAFLLMVMTILIYVLTSY